MKKRYLILALLIIVLSSILIIFFIPSYYVGISNHYMSWDAGLTQKTNDTYSLSYYENDSDNPTLVLLYPQGDKKEGFLKLAKFLTDKYHLIIPDIPYTHGNGNIKQNTILKIVQQYDKILDNKNITQSSWFGVGIGAHFASAYALYQPKKVKNLVLMGNDGTSGIEIPKQELLSEENFELVLKKYFYTPPGISSFQKNYYIKEINKSLNMVEEWKKAEKEDVLFQHLKDSLTMIEAPTLILWPDKGNDIVNYVESQKVYHTIPVSKFVTLKNTSLLAYREQPQELSKIIDDFINEVKTNYLHFTLDKHKIETQLFNWLSYFGQEQKKQSLDNHLNNISPFIQSRTTGGFFGGIQPYTEKMIPIIAKVPYYYEVISKSITPSVLGHFNIDLLVKKQKSIMPLLSNMYHEKIRLELKNDEGYHFPKIDKLNMNIVDVLPVDSVALKKSSNTHYHRMKSLVYYWLYLLEKSFKKKEQFAKVLADSFEVTMGLPLKGVKLNHFTTMDQLLNYFSEAESQLKITSQNILNLKMVKLEKERFQVDAKISWRGIFIKNNELVLQTFYVKLIVLDNLKKEYPTIESLSMSALDAPRVLF